jgi:hypothetical protein
MYFTRRAKSKKTHYILVAKCVFLLSLLVSCNRENNIGIPELGTLKVLLIESRINDEKREHLLSEADTYLKATQKGKRLEAIAPWAILMEAKLTFLYKEKGSAIELLETIPEDHPAFLDASLFKINAGLSSTGTYGSFDRDLVLLEAQIKKTGQESLLPELLLAKAASHRKRNDHHAALNLYYNIRSKFHNTTYAKVAKREISALTSGSDAPLPLRSLADMLEESRILIDENDFQEAYKQLEIAKKSIQENTPAFYEMQLEEISLLLASGRVKESRILLSYLSSHASPLISARAVIMLAHLFLQEGLYEQGESMLMKHKTKLSNSPLFEDFLLLLVEINIRKNLLEEAAQTAHRALEKKLSLRNELALLKHLAWINILKKDIPLARSYFTLLLERTTDVLQLTANNENPRVLLEEYFPYTERNTIKRKLHRDERQTISQVIQEAHDLHTHTQYWSAILDLQAGKDNVGNQALLDLVSSAPVTYYGMLAKNAVLQSGASKETTRDRSLSCSLKSGKEYPDSNITSLIRSGLHEEATRQILWDLSSRQSDLQSGAHSSEALIPLHIAHNMNAAGLASQSLEYLARELPPWKFELILIENDRPACTQKYLTVFFQRPDAQETDKILKKYNVPLPFALSMYQYHHVNEAPLPVPPDFSKVPQDVSGKPLEMLLHIYSTAHEMKEYQLLKERFPDFSDEMILETLPGDNTRKAVKNIMTGYHIYSDRD